MALKTLVKVGKISNLSDARYCAGMGVNLLGFVTVDGQDQYVSPSLFKEIRGWFSGPQIVAEAYGVTTQEQLNHIVQNYVPDLIELSFNELSQVRTDSNKYILAINEEQLTQHQKDIDTLKNQIEYLLVPVNLDQAMIRRLSGDFKILIEIISPGNVDSILENETISGINLKGTSEERPGFKSYDQLAEIFERLEVEEW